GELKRVLPIPWPEQHLIHGFQEILLGAGRHVQAVHQAIRIEIFDQLLLQDGIIVAVVQRAGATEEIYVFLVLLVYPYGAAGLLEYDWKGPDVAPYFRLHPVKYF